MAAFLVISLCVVEAKLEIRLDMRERRITIQVNLLADIVKRYWMLNDFVIVRVIFLGRFGEKERRPTFTAA